MMQETAERPLDRALSDLKDRISRIGGDAGFGRRQALLVSLKALLDCRETPCWLKAIDGRMLYLNPAYTREFGKTLADYGGNYDSSQWGEPTGLEFGGNDARALECGHEITVIEDVPGKDGEVIPYKIKKWPVYLDGEAIGCAGESLGPVDA